MGVARRLGPIVLGDKDLEMKILEDLLKGARYRATGSMEDLKRHDQLQRKSSKQTASEQPEKARSNDRNGQVACHTV